MTDDLPQFVTRGRVARIMCRTPRKLPDLLRDDPSFPRPVRIGRRMYWVEAEILSYIGRILRDRGVAA